MTYVPARNTVFLSLALAWAEALGVFDIGIGANALDYSGYPDCRPEYLRRSSRWPTWPRRPASKAAASTFTRRCCTMTKAEIIQRGVALGLDYGLTHSCYDPLPDGARAAAATAASLRAKGFAEAGVPDPLSRMTSPVLRRQPPDVVLAAP